MKTMYKPLLTLTAGDIMTGPVRVLPHGMTLQAAAQLLRREQISGAPVVDDLGRCVGVLSAADFLRSADQGGDGQDREVSSIRTCSFQEDVQSADGKKMVGCTLFEGACPMQSHGINKDGKHALFCREPHCVVVDWQQVTEESSTDDVSQYMTKDVVTVKPTALVSVVARMMVDAHIHRIIVVDDADRPVGIVTSTDMLGIQASLAAEDQ
jgi:CBS domain-containing protein